MSFEMSRSPNLTYLLETNSTETNSTETNSTIVDVRGTRAKIWRGQETLRAFRVSVVPPDEVCLPGAGAGRREQTLVANV